ncbi:G_PROTEIN_RECEP_F1_2 domain-containing protein [Meloidogyne graminicola]|uniref:G_PROTEIN_RECEP_F1_2 domain-containing protein n=1 Tax=Meloidogyne graminicola TaxID=189291 RepID=A0A8S9ZW12_9BILA|nr:G_PROTEIN_RECEP_F1_2 domain-containing protein [Meloidogyne graminicola]
MVQAVSVLVSTFSLSAIAINRYLLVNCPYNHSISTKQATIVAIILWKFSLLISLPYAYYMGLEEYEGYCGQFCSEQWPNNQIRRGYALIVLAIQFLLPFIIMLFCYFSIFSKLKRRNNSKLKKLNERQNILNNEKENCLITTKIKNNSKENIGELNILLINKQQRRTTTILASAVLFFGLAWLPQNVLTMIIEYDIQLLYFKNNNYLYLFSLISHSIAMTTNVANPILYAWLNPTFKELFIKTVNPLTLRKRNDELINQRRNYVNNNLKISLNKTATTIQNI